MKSLSNLEGVIILSKKQLIKINGTDRYCSNGLCCITTSSGYEICEAGHCYGYYSCTWL